MPTLEEQFQVIKTQAPADFSEAADATTLEAARIKYILGKPAVS